MFRWLTKLCAWWCEPPCSASTEDRMRSLSVPTPDATFWDIARDDESKQPEPGRVEYRFLGITGLEDE
jgi:hypothetical protein